MAEQLSGFMENGGSESTMHVLVWGIVLLGGIGGFIVQSASVCPTKPVK